MRELLFLVDNRLPQELKDSVRDVAAEISTIFKGTRAIYHDSEFIDKVAIRSFTYDTKSIGSTKHGIQRDARQMAELVDKASRKEGRCTFFITIDDLAYRHPDNYDGIKSCLGFATETAIIISVARFRWYSIEDRKMILSDLIMHEIGHLHGVVGENEANCFNAHCPSKYCVMHQSVSLAEFSKNFKLIKLRAMSNKDTIGKYFCSSCRQNIMKLNNSHHKPFEIASDW